MFPTGIETSHLQAPWSELLAPNACAERRPSEIDLVQPYARDRSAEEYIFASVGDVEAQVAALWSRQLALDEATNDGLSRLSSDIEREIVPLVNSLRETMQDAIDVVGARTAQQQGARTVARLRLLLAAHRAEAAHQDLQDVAWQVHSKSLSILERRTCEPLFSFVTELSRLAEQMLPRLEAQAKASREGNAEAAFDLADEVVAAEDIFQRHYEEAVSKVPAYIRDEPPEATDARLQLLLLGEVARRKLHIYALEDTKELLELKSSPPRTWPFGAAVGSEDIGGGRSRSATSRFNASRRLAPERVAVRRTIVARFWRPIPAVVESEAAQRAVDALTQFIERVDLKDGMRARVQRLMERLAMGRTSNFDYGELRQLVRMDEARMRRLERGHGIVAVSEEEEACIWVLSGFLEVVKGNARSPRPFTASDTLNVRHRRPDSRSRLGPWRV